MEQEKDIETRILCAAREVFIRKGYDTATMSDIALLAGMSRTSVNYYFRTKERLFEAIFEEIIAKVYPQMEEIVDKNCSYIEKIGLLADQYQTLIIQYPSLPVFLVREIQRDCNHLIKTATKLLGDCKVPASLLTQLLSEMEKGNIRKMNPADVLTTFIGSFVFPLLTENMITTLLFDNDKEKFSQYITHRKELTMRIMTDLLKP
ncbi:MAG: TetR/AcrR family transcriptional regulator [Flavobacteriales bacterium]|nr:TetR/AcrR family transcriptional regulator [Flavobacteriales bacterium]